MNKQNFDKLAETAEKRSQIREKRKRKRMKVSGAAVKTLQSIIIKQNHCQIAKKLYN